jgi:hypothetical protein
VLVVEDRFVASAMLSENVSYDNSSITASSANGVTNLNLSVLAVFNFQALGSGGIPEELSLTILG